LAKGRGRLVSVFTFERASFPVLKRSERVDFSAICFLPPPATSAGKAGDDVKR
jgi:hypothetical protein